MSVTITGAVWPTCPTARVGPFQDNSGNLWVVAFNSSLQIVAFQSTDGGSTWNSTNVYTIIAWDGATLDCAYDSVNQIVYALVASGHTFRILQFSISSLTWSSFATQSNTIQPDINNQYPGFLIRRSDGSFVVVYQGPTAAVMGTSYRQMYYITCPSGGGSFGTATLMLSDGASNGEHIDTKCAVLGTSDFVHALGHAASGSTSGTIALQRQISLSSSNVLGTEGSTPGAVYNSDYASLFYDAILAQLVVSPGTHSTVYGPVSRATSVANPSWTNDSDNVGSDWPATCPAMFYYDSSQSKLYCFYADATTGFLNYNTTTTTTWGVGAQLPGSTPITPKGISPRAITGGIGIVWGDNTANVHFDKYSIVSPPFIPRRMPLGC